MPGYAEQSREFEYTWSKFHNILKINIPMNESPLKAVQYENCPTDLIHDVGDSIIVIEVVWFPGDSVTDNVFQSSELRIVKNAKYVV